MLYNSQKPYYKMFLLHLESELIMAVKKKKKTVNKSVPTMIRFRKGDFLVKSALQGRGFAEGTKVDFWICTYSGEFPVTEATCTEIPAKPYNYQTRKFEQQTNVLLSTVVIMSRSQLLKATAQCRFTLNI